MKSLKSFFAVPKAGTDIQVVYDATQCGLNDALWAPNFRFHFKKCLRATWFGDIDLVEMFLNYTLDLDIRQYAGVDITELDAEKVGSTCKHVLERWTRSLIGFKPSPYVCTMGTRLLIPSAPPMQVSFQGRAFVLLSLMQL